VWLDEEETVDQGSRSIWKRLAAAATVLALAAAPVWASDLQLKKKEDPKANQEQGAKPKDGEKKDASEPADKKKKKNCPIDNSTFNTLEDMYGFLGTVDELALPKVQPAEVAEKPTGGESAGTQRIEWREADKSEDKSEDKDEKDKKE
jgi:hypothetical protein